jgi:hypothetical protein
MLSCEEVTQLVSTSMDQKLPLHRRLQVKIHFLFCEACARYRKQLLFLRELASRLPAEMEETASLSTPSLSADARERMKHSLRHHTDDSPPEVI